MINNVKLFKGLAINYAREFAWKQNNYKPEKELMQFSNKGMRCHMDVYLRSLKVVTCMEHPKGTSVLERTGVSPSELKLIFEDPRTHTKKGNRLK
jgi:hypothetical protein